MPDAPPAPSPAGRPRRSLARILLDIAARGYAIAIIAIVLGLSFLALRYLVVTLILPSAAPPQITGIPTRMTETLLLTRRTQWPGVVETENPRTPLAHYHRLDSWIQPDRFNSCTQSGCHAPLPHARRKEVRAFLNMHATSLHCGVCHLRSDAPLATTWYDLRTGKARPAPVVLQAYAWLMSDEGRRALSAPTPAAQHKLVGLLRAAAREADNEPTLTNLANDIAAERYDSPAFATLLETAQATLPRHFRGEYGAKLALRDSASGQPMLAHPDTQEAVRTYLREAASADPQRLQELLAAVHPARRIRSLHCTDCHTATGGLLAFAAAGYPPARIAMLSQPVIFSMIEHIAAGQPFYLPSLVTPESVPTTDPDSEPR
jgi:hypothetical protein